MTLASSPSRTSARTPGHPVGALLRDWRARRRLSQMELALEVGVSPRHLSFIETGRSRPSAGMVLALAERLDMPLRERNRFLMAAGHAPRFSERGLDAHAMAPVRAALQRLLDAHDPYPGVVLDRQWNIVLANGAALRLVAALPEPLRTVPMNLFRASLHPEGMAAWTENFEEWGRYLMAALRRAVSDSADVGLSALLREVSEYPNVRALADAPEGPGGDEPPLLVPCVLNLPLGRISLFSTLTAFGTPRDITLSELCVELFYPNDEATEAILRGAAMPGTSAPGCAGGA